MAQQIQLRRGLAAAWTAANPVLAAGEKGIEIDTGKEKNGNGVTAWNSLAYSDSAGSAAALAAHVAASDPHPGYLTTAEGATLITGLETTSGSTAKVAAEAVLRAAADTAAIAAAAADATTKANAAQTAAISAAATASATAIATQHTADISQFAPQIMAINAQIGTSYTTVLADGAKWITWNNASASVLTVAPSIHDPGTMLQVTNRGAGALTLTPGAGVTFIFRGATVASVLLPQYHAASIECIATNLFEVSTDVREETIGIVLSDETTTITTGTAKATFHLPWPFVLESVMAELNTVSSSGIPTVDINVNGSTILSTKLTIDASELTSITAATAAVMTSTSFVRGDSFTFDQDVAGTGAKGMKVWLVGYRT